MPSPGADLATVHSALRQLKAEIDRLARRPAGDSTHDGTGANSTQIGQSAAATGAASTAVGDGSSAVFGSTALGVAAAASGSLSTSLGQSSAASGSGALAVGAGSLASGASSQALGTNAHATGTSSVAIGPSATCAVDYRAVIAANELQLDRSDGATGATSLILRDTAGTRWRVSVTTGGAVSVAAA